MLRAQLIDGRTIVNPPSRHVGGGVFETAVSDGDGGFYYPSDILVKAPYTFRTPSPFQAIGFVDVDKL